MKKLIAVLAIITLVGCGKTVPSANMNNSVEEKKSIVESVTEINEEVFDAITDIEIDMPDETYYLNNSKIMFSDGNKRYYYVYKSGRENDYYVLGCETEDRKYSFLNNADDFTAYLYKNGTFYGTYRQDKFCSFINGDYTPLQYEEQNISDVYFTEEYIYFLLKDDSGTQFMRMKYDSSDAEIVACINLQVSKYSVKNNLIFYEADYLRYGVYDIENSIDTSINEGGAGIFSGDYMYFVSNEHNLLRMDLNDYTCEKLSENVRRISFYDGYILYQPYTDDAVGDGQLYRLGKGENVKIFDSSQILENNYYYDISVQTEEEKIFIKVDSGPYYTYIAEIDINGNIIEDIYEHNSV